MSAKTRGTKAKTKARAKARGTKAKTKARDTSKEKGNKGSGKLHADAQVGLESDSLNEIKDAASDTFDNIKSGLKIARRKIGEHI